MKENYFGTINYQNNINVFNPDKNSFLSNNTFTNSTSIGASQNISNGNDSIGIEECSFGNPTVCSNEDVFNYEICKIEDVSSKEIECKDSAIPDNKIVERILKVINYKYDDSLTEVSAKLSVTQITQKYLKDDSSIDIRLSRPRFISGLDKLIVYSIKQLYSFDHL